jgi:hypothetical protein
MFPTCSSSVRVVLPARLRPFARDRRVRRPARAPHREAVRVGARPDFFDCSRSHAFGAIWRFPRRLRARADGPTVSRTAGGGRHGRRLSRGSMPQPAGPASAAARSGRHAALVTARGPVRRSPAAARRRDRRRSGREPSRGRSEEAERPGRDLRRRRARRPPAIVRVRPRGPGGPSTKTTRQHPRESSGGPSRCRTRRRRPAGSDCRAVAGDGDATTSAPSRDLVAEPRESQASPRPREDEKSGQPRCGAAATTHGTTRPVASRGMSARPSTATRQPTTRVARRTAVRMARSRISRRPVTFSSSAA